MERIKLAIQLALLLAALTVVFAESTVAETIPAASTKSLKVLSKDKHPDIDHVEIKGENPQVIYIPIIHDNPEHRHAEQGTREAIEQALVRCQRISEYLYAEYGVRNILLEGISKTLSDKYNSPEYRGRKLSVGKSDSIIFKVWFDLLNKNEWRLIPSFEKRVDGPLTMLGQEYNQRIQEAFQTAKEKGWFRSKEAFASNGTAFTDLLTEACKGYNARLDALLKEDPGLKREYDITVTQRNNVFIDNTLAAKAPGIIMCGGGHVQDLIDQFEKREISYMIVVPKGIKWPPVKKDAQTIYNDMLQLGCQLKKSTIQFGDGGSAVVTIPIK